jgi:hypothetical protein
MVVRPVRPRPRPGCVPTHERRRARRPWIRPIRAVADAHPPQAERVQMRGEPPTRPVADTVVPHRRDRLILGVDDEKSQAGSGERPLEQVHPHPAAGLGAGHAGRADTDPRRQLPLAQVRPPARPAQRAGDVEARVHAGEPRCPTRAAESAPTNLWTTSPPVHNHLTTPPAAVPRRAPTTRRLGSVSAPRAGAQTKPPRPAPPAMSPTPNGYVSAPLRAAQAKPGDGRL